MSEAISSLQADYLTCTLCSQPFKQPKTLPCLHNFCKACLANYLEEEMSGGKCTTFDCPECRKKIFVPDPSKPANRWATQFPTNFTLSGMIEAIAEEAQAKGRGVAMVKEARERRGLGADTTDVPSGEKGPTEKQLSKDCSQDSSTVDIDSTQCILSSLQEELHKDQNRLQHEIQTSDKHLKEEQRKLEQSFAKIVMLLEARKAQLMEELEANLGQEKERLEQAASGCSNDLKSLGSCEELLDGLDTNPMEDEVVYDMLQSIRDQVKEIEARRGSHVLGRYIKFEQTLEAARSVLNMVNDLGQVSISTSTIVTDDNASDSSTILQQMARGAQQRSFDSDSDKKETKIRSKPKFLTAISTRQDDGTHQQIYDLTITANGTVVMTSHNSNSLLAARKSQDSDGQASSDYSVYASLQLDSQPKCLAAIAPFYVAVTGTSCIYLVGVDEKLSLQRKISTGKDYQGITTYSEASLIATSQRPACIDFVAISGYISETVDRDHTTGNILLRQPQFIATSKDGVIYVTDAGKKPKLISINNAGMVRFQCPGDGQGGENPSSNRVPLEVPQGVCVDSQGHVYVVDRAACTVVLLTSEGEKIKDILTAEDGLSNPYAIAMDLEDHLYVTNEFNEILVFQVR